MGEEALLDPDRLERAFGELRERRRRDQLYFALALVIVGGGALAALLLASYHSARQGERIRELTLEVEEIAERARMRSKALALDVARQERELEAIRKAATEDLRAIQEAYRRVAAIEDPGRELTALREANEALWSELASQREELLLALTEREVASELSDDPGELVPAPRFLLGDTEYREASGGAPGAVAGFVSGEAPVRRASAPPPGPGFLILELTPESVALGERFRLVVKLMNRGNRPLSLQELRLDWSFAGKNTGGLVPLTASRVVEPRATRVIYDQTGLWEPPHDHGGVVLGATLTLADGARLANSLRW